MTHDELLAKIEKQTVHIANKIRPVADECEKEIGGFANALRAVVKLIQEKQKFLENTGVDIPMTNQQLGAREERTKLLAEIKQAIEKELK